VQYSAFVLLLRIENGENPYPLRVKGTAPRVDVVGLQVYFHFVYVAPGPIFAGLEGLHDGVLGLLEMLGGVLVLGGIAAAYVTALHA
jgi:hypothetical protein